MIREIIKDAQDMEGDKEMGSRTLPIYFGIKVTKRVIIGLTVFSAMVLGFFFLSYLRDWISLTYFCVALLLPFIYLIIRTIKSENASDFQFISKWAKVIMLLGLLYAPLVNWLIKNFLNR
jgi:4-hydroxybenzoate polyprenyltransferase